MGQVRRKEVIVVSGGWGSENHHGGEHVGVALFKCIYIFNQDKDKKLCRGRGKGKKNVLERLAGLSWSMAKCKGRARCHST